MGLYIIPVRARQYGISVSVNGRNKNKKIFFFFVSDAQQLKIRVLLCNETKFYTPPFFFCGVNLLDDTKLHCYDELMLKFCHKNNFSLKPRRQIQKKIKQMQFISADEALKLERNTFIKLFYYYEFCIFIICPQSTITLKLEKCSFYAAKILQLLLGLLRYFATG